MVTQKNQNDAGEVWRNLSETYKNELQAFFLNFQFPGRGQSPQPVITLPGALKLVMWLPGNAAKEYRTKACEILTRYIAGDASLIAEIDANAASTAPINVMARDALASEQRLDDGRPDELVRSVSQQQTVLVTGLEELKPIVAIVQQQAATNERMSAALIAQTQQFSATTALQAQQLDQANAAADRERHLRHQADGRYGSGIREATKEVRKRAADADARAVAAEERAAVERREHLKERQEHLRSIQEITQHAVEERRAAAASHQLLAETLAKLVQRLT